MQKRNRYRYQEKLDHIIVVSLYSHICERLHVGVCPLLLGWRLGACVYALTVCGDKCLHLLCVSVGVCLTHCACMYLHIHVHVCVCSDVALA